MVWNTFGPKIILSSRYYRVWQSESHRKTHRNSSEFVGIGRNSDVWTQSCQKKQHDKIIFGPNVFQIMGFYHNFPVEKGLVVKVDISGWKKFRKGIRSQRQLHKNHPNRFCVWGLENTFPRSVRGVPLQSRYRRLANMIKKWYFLRDLAYANSTDTFDHSQVLLHR